MLLCLEHAFGATLESWPPKGLKPKDVPSMHHNSQSPLLVHAFTLCPCMIACQQIFWKALTDVLFLTSSMPSFSTRHHITWSQPKLLTWVIGWLPRRAGFLGSWRRRWNQPGRPDCTKRPAPPKGRPARLRGLPATVGIAAGTYRWEPAKIAERKAAFSTHSGSWDTSGFQFQ